MGEWRGSGQVGFLVDVPVGTLQVLTDWRWAGGGAVSNPARGRPLTVWFTSSALLSHKCLNTSRGSPAPNGAFD